MTAWTLGEKNVIANAAVAAPSVHNSQPWVLELPDGRDEITLRERRDRALPHHDPLGRDRLISCGAALENIVLTTRVLGRVPEVAVFPDPARPELIATITATARTVPSDVDIARHAAIPHRHSHRGQFRRGAVSPAVRNRLLAANRVDGVGVRLVTSAEDVEALARVLSHSALVLRADHAYQRELSAWTAAVRAPLPGAGLSSATRRTSTLPWAGLVRRTTALPDLPTLAHRLRGELLLLVETVDDGPHDHVRAGMAAEAVWLAAVTNGLAGSLLTQPFQVPEARAGFVEALSLNGFPQLLLRFGLELHDEDRR